MKKVVVTLVLLVSFFMLISSCKEKAKQAKKETAEVITYPSDVIPFMDKFRILLGDGTYTDSLVNFEKKEFFYVANDGKSDWVVYKTLNSGVTSGTSSNTRSELGEKKHWISEEGGKLTGNGMPYPRWAPKTLIFV